MSFRGGRGRYNDQVPEGYELGQIQQFTPKQMGLLNQSIKDVGPDSYLSKLAGGDQDTFNQMEAPAMRQFQGTLGGIASRFSGQGMGSRKSSGFQNTTTSAASNFAQDLQAQRQSLQRQAVMDLQGIRSNLMGQRPYERTISEKPAEWWEGPLTGFATGAGQAAGKFAFGG